MSSAQSLREFVTERLTAAAEEIFTVFEKTIVEYEAEIDRQRRLLEVVWKPQIKLHRLELLQQHVCKKKDVLSDQQLYNQERDSSLEQEDPDPPQMKEEQEELCTSQEGEQLVAKQGTNAFTLTPTYKESDHSDPEPNHHPQLHCHSQRHSGSTRNAEPKPKKRRHIKSVDNCTMSATHCDTRHAELLLQHAGEEEEEVLTKQQLYNQEKNSSLDQEDPDAPQIKEEQEELCTSQKGEQLVLKQDTHHIMLIPVYEERDQQLLVLSSPVAESQHREGNKHGHSALTGNTEPHPKKRRHKNTSHRDNVENSCKKKIYNHTGEKRYVCNACGKSFDYASTLKMHIRIHTGEKPYACKTCGKAFRLNSNLKIHIRRAHTGERPYLCNTCGKRFTEGNELVKHERVHTGERPYVCNICGKTFKQTSALNCHLKTHRGEKRYFCNSQVNWSPSF